MLLGVGVLAPIVLFVVAFYDLEGLRDLYRGLFVVPLRRLDHTSWPAPGLAEYIFVIPYGVLLAASVFAPSKRLPRWLLLLTVLAMSGLLSFAHQASVYAAVWSSLRPMIPLTVVFSCIALLRFKDKTPKARRHLFAATCALAFCSLGQFPVSHGIYFCYVAVFLVLALAALVHFVELRFGWLHLAVATFFLLFAMMWESQNPAYNLGARYIPVSESYELQNPRGGIRVHKAEGELYDFVVEFILERSEGDSFIFAGPDSPEIYFLTGKRSPVPYDYDFLAEESGKDLLELIDDVGINLAVINLLPEYSSPYSAGFAAALEERYPHSRTFSKYRVMWRE